MVTDQPILTAAGYAANKKELDYAKAWAAFIKSAEENEVWKEANGVYNVRGWNGNYLRAAENEQGKKENI